MWEHMKINNNRYIATSSKWKSDFLRLTCKQKKGNAEAGQLVKLGVTPKLLIVRIEHLGDVVTNLGLINQIKSVYPNAEIDILINSQSKQVLESILVDCNRVLAVPTPIAHSRSNKSLAFKLVATAWCYIKSTFIFRRNYDIVIFTSHHLYGLQLMGLFCQFSIAYSSVGFGWFHNYVVDNKEDWSISQRICAMAHALTGKYCDPASITYKSKRLTRIVNEISVENSGKDTVIIAPKAGTWAKSLSVNEIHKILKKENLNHILVVGKYDLDQVDAIRNHCKRLDILELSRDIRDLTKALSVCKAVITTDSFIAHLAAAICSNEVNIWFRERELMPKWTPPGKNIKVRCLDEL